MLGLTDIGRVTISELHGENSIAPNVHLCIISSFTLNQFGRHPADSADLAGSSVSLGSELSGVTEVGKFDLASFVDEYIITLYISVDYVAGV